MNNPDRFYWNSRPVNAQPKLIDINSGLERYRQMVKQSSSLSDLDVESRSKKYQSLMERKVRLERNVDRIQAELAVCRRDLKRYMDDCKANGFDPNNLKDEIKKKLEILDIKLDTFEADIKAGEDQIAPMLIEIQKG